MTSFFQELSNEDLDKIKALAVKKTYPAGTRVFSEGDAADYLYFIDSGKVSIFIEKFNSKEEIQTLGAGEFFGEMAMFFNNTRTACAAAKEDTTFLSVAKKEFLSLMESERAIADKINKMLTQRNEELILREKLIDVTGLDIKHLHIGIKGDPSLRESAMTRERHESEVDKILPQLVPHLEDLLINRCAYQIYIGFNNGEIRISTILDPFSEEFHPAKRLLDQAYIDRHFPLVSFEEKAEVIRHLYQSLHQEQFFKKIPESLQNIFSKFYKDWRPVQAKDIARTLSSLTTLRAIPDYYVRNATISIIKDAIHMQFNCDGAHIVSAEDYERFLKENL